MILSIASSRLIFPERGSIQVISCGEAAAADSLDVLTIGDGFDFELRWSSEFQDEGLWFVTVGIDASITSNCPVFTISS